LTCKIEDSSAHRPALHRLPLSVVAATYGRPGSVDSACLAHTEELVDIETVSDEEMSCPELGASTLMRSALLEQHASQNVLPSRRRHNKKHRWRRHRKLPITLSALHSAGKSVA
jgi:hypothetical protein